MGKRRRDSSTSSTSSRSSSSSSSSSSDCAGRYKRKHRKHQKMSAAYKAHTKSHTPPRDTTNRYASNRRIDSPNTVEVAGSSSSISVAQESQDAQQRIKDLEDLVNQLLEKNSVTRVSIRPDCIPEFSCMENENCRKWLDKIDQLADINRWDEKTTIYHMQSRLGGLAKTWYNSLENYMHSWAEWKCLLIQAFPDHQDYPTALKNLIHRLKRPNETWTEYYFAKTQLLRQCDITGRNAVAMIIDGIQDSTIQSGAKVGRYATPEILYSDYLSTLTVTKTNDPKPGYSGYKRPDKKFEQNRAEIKPDFRQNLTRGKCFNCKQFGHIQKDCPSPKIECTVCKKLGHRAETCYKNKNRPSHSRNAMLCHTKPRPETNGYFVNCAINSHNIEGFIDSGCEVVIIRQSDAKYVGITWTETDVCLNGYGGCLTKVLGTSQVKLKVDLFEAEVPIFIVMDNLQTMPLLIGRSVLDKTDAVTVVRNGTVRLFNSEMAQLPEVDVLPQKLCLKAKENVEIPPNHVGIIRCKPITDYTGDIFVNIRKWYQPTKECVVPSCVTSSLDAKLPVLNLSETTISVNQGQIVARGVPCIPENLGVSVNKVDNICLPKFSVDDIKYCVSEKVSGTDLNKLLLLINKYRDCFAQNINELSEIKHSKMTINLLNDKPVTYRPYRLSFNERGKVREIVNELLNAKIIQESDSPYASPIVLVKKKNGETRMCVDYRALNTKTIKDCYPLPRIDEHLERLKECKYFTTLDMASGYHQIKMAEESRQKTAFVTPDGQYEYLRMPFGLVNAPAVFQRTINQILGSMRFSTALAYMDDVLVPSSSLSSGLIALADVLETFRSAGVTLRLDKCRFFQTTINYLGHEISAEGIRPGTTKINAVKEFPVPRNVHQIRQFVGLCSYFRKYVKNFAQIARPLTSLTKKDVPFEWGADQQEAFGKLKETLIGRPVLAIYDPKFETEVHTDASKFGLGGILLQKQEDGRLKPVIYFSRQTSKEEQRFHSYELETLAVINSLQRFRVYLIGLKFTVVTDCSALRTAMTKRDLIPRIARWWLTAQEFDFSVEYRAGTRMGHVDALSRNPVDTPDGNNRKHNIMDVLQVDISKDDWVLAVQIQDDQCKHIIKILQNKPNDSEEKQIHIDYEVKNNKLYRRTTNGLRWYIPKAARRVVTMYHHDNNGHFAAEKTMKLISNKYWFPRMKKYVTRYISSCLECAYNKVPAGKKEGFLHPIEKIPVPMDTIHIDHVGPFVKSTKGNSYLIVAVDAFTKFLWMKAVNSTKTKPVMNFLENVFETFGVSKRIICDRGSSFTSDAFIRFTKDLSIQVVYNATATPRANGQVERFNRTLLNSISTNHNDERKWDQSLGSIAFAVNSAPNDTTGKSPYQLLLGYTPRGMRDSFLSMAVVQDEVDNDILKTRKDTGMKIQQMQVKQKAHFDAKRKQCYEYRVGDLVLLRKTNLANDGKSQKLVPKFNGPYVINKVLDLDRYVVEDLPGSTRARKKYLGVSSAERMKLFKAAYESDSKTESENEGS